MRSGVGEGRLGAVAGVADRKHPCRYRGGDARRRVLHHDAEPWVHVHRRGCVKKQVGMRFASRHGICREQRVRAEQTSKAGMSQSELGLSQLALRRNAHSSSTIGQPARNAVRRSSSSMW